MSTVAFVKSIALVAACICSANVQTTEHNGNLDLELAGNVFDSLDWPAQHGRHNLGVMNQSGDARFAVATIELPTPTVNSLVNPEINQDAGLHHVQSGEFMQNESSFFKAQAYTPVLASYVAESFEYWQAFVQDKHIGFSFKGRAWAIGSLID